MRASVIASLGHSDGTGLYGHQLTAGTLINGWGRVARMTRTTGKVIVYRQVTRTTRGKTRTTIGDPREFLLSERVPGTRYRTDIPAGPVHREPGRFGKVNGRGVGETRAERHASMLANISY